MKYIPNLVKTSQPVKSKDPDQGGPPPKKAHYSNFVRASSTLIGSTSSNNAPKTQQQISSISRTKQSKYDLIIVKLEYMPDENPCNVLNRSAAFSKTSITWEIVKGPGVGTPGAIDNYHRCNMKLQNDIIHTALGIF